MTKSKLIINILIYSVVTIFLLYVLIREDSVSCKLATFRLRFTDKFIKICNIASDKAKLFVKNLIWLIEFVATTAILLIIIRTMYIGNFVVPTGSMIPAILEGDRLFANMAIYKFRAPRRGEVFVFREPVQDKVLYTKRVMGLPGESVNISDGYLYVNGEQIADRYYSNVGDMADSTWIIPKKGDQIEIIPQMDYASFFSKNTKNIDIDSIQKEFRNNPYILQQYNIEMEVRVNGVSTGPMLDILHDKKYMDMLFRGETVTFTCEQDYYLALGDNTNNSFDSRMWGFVAFDRIKGKPLVRFWPLNRIGILR